MGDEKESQQLFLDFLDISKEDPRSKQQGVYTFKILINQRSSCRCEEKTTRYYKNLYNSILKIRIF